MATSSRDRGQAAVEFALMLPLIVVVIAFAAQLGIAIRNELAVGLAAREGARAAAASASPASAAAQAAQRAVDLPIDVSTTESVGRVRVTVRYTDPTDVVLIGRLLGPITHRATVTMAVEPP